MKKGAFVFLLFVLSFLPAISRQMINFISGLTYSITTKFPVDSAKVVLWKGGQAIDSTIVEMLKVNGKVRPYFNFGVMEVGNYTVKFSHFQCWYHSLFGLQHRYDSSDRSLFNLERLEQLGEDNKRSLQAAEKEIMAPLIPALYQVQPTRSHRPVGNNIWLLAKDAVRH